MLLPNGKTKNVVINLYGRVIVEGVSGLWAKLKLKGMLSTCDKLTIVWIFHEKEK